MLSICKQNFMTRTEDWFNTIQSTLISNFAELKGLPPDMIICLSFCQAKVTNK